MLKERLNSGWIFYNVRDESNKILVNLPHDAMLTEKRLPGLTNGHSTGYFPGGKYVYTKTLFGKSEFDNKTVIIEFEGVYMKSKIYLNGEEIGGRIYGYSNFYVDLTDKLLIGQDNEIKVIVDNTQTQNSRWYSGSGIYRDVNIFVGNKNHIELDGLRIVTKSVKPAVLGIEVKAVKEESMDILTEIIKDGRTVASGKGDMCEIMVPNAELWDAENPNLYEVKVTLLDNGRIVDEVRDHTGIRKLEWNSKNGFLVNGKSVKLRGGCIHHDNGPLGASSFEKAEYRRIKIMKEAGFNAIRYSHNPANKAVLDACDELGMYVMNEAFDTWRNKKSDYDYGLYFDAEWEKDVTSMVMKSLNHPSVIMYSIGNEILELGKPEGLDISRKIHNLCKKLDPTRPTVNCMNVMLIGMAALGFAVNKSDTTVDDIVDPYLEGRNSKAAGSALANILITLLPLLPKVFGSPKRIDKLAKEAFDTVNIVGYNYAEHSYKKHNKWHPERVIVASETFPKHIARNWNLVKEIPNLIGDFMWTGWDYLGEAGIGVTEYGKSSGAFTKPYPCIGAGVGAIDITGFIETQGYYSMIVWNLYKKPYISVRPVNKSGEKFFLGQWRGTDAVHSWTWTGQEGRNAEIEVYSIGETVELIQDGKSVGKHRLKDYKARFKTVYRPGKLVAVSYDDFGKEIARSELKTAADETVLKVLPEETVIKADGQDLAYIPVHITDNAGITKMLVDRQVKVEVEGVGILAGVGSGNPITEEQFTGNSYTTYQGRMIAVVRSNGEKGQIKVTFSAPELESKEITILAR
jgi:beta-galactosidase